MADDGPTSPADSPAYRHADDDSTPVPVASTILFKTQPLPATAFPAIAAPFRATL